MKFPTVLTSSMISDFAICPFRFKTKYIDNIMPEHESIHLAAGKAYAAGLHIARKAFFKDNLPAEQAYEKGFVALLKAWDFPDAGSKTKKPIDAMLGAYDFYFRKFPLEGERYIPAMMWGDRALEFSFNLPIPIRHPQTNEEILLGGRCDQIVDCDGVILIEDDKTTTQMGPTWSSNFRLRGQFIQYTWAANQLKIPALGVLTRGIAVRSTGFDTAQAIMWYEPHIISYWYRTTLARVERMVAAFNKWNWEYNFDQGCTSYGGCAYVDYCATSNRTTVPGYKVVEKHYYEEGDE